MQPSDFQLMTLPYLAITDHLLPPGKRKIWGSGLLFTHTIRDATRTGGLWLVMQDCDGHSAMSEGDVVIRTEILTVDWLSGSQVCVALNITGWGIVENSGQAEKTGQLSARLRPLWAAKPQYPSDGILAVRLRQWQHEYGSHSAGLPNHPAGTIDPCWLCWRWLELLPLPLPTKQRLLKAPDPRTCLRYLKIMIRQSDLYAGLLR